MLESVHVFSCSNTVFIHSSIPIHTLRLYPAHTSSAVDLQSRLVALSDGLDLTVDSAVMSSLHRSVPKLAVGSDTFGN